MFNDNYFYMAYIAVINGIYKDNNVLSITSIINPENLMAMFVKTLKKRGLGYWIEQYENKLKEQSKNEEIEILHKILQNTENDKSEQCGKGDSIGELLKRLAYADPFVDPKKDSINECFGLLHQIMEKISDIDWNDGLESRIYAVCLLQALQKLKMIMAMGSVIVCDIQDITSEAYFYINRDKYDSNASGILEEKGKDNRTEVYSYTNSDDYYSIVSGKYVDQGDENLSNYAPGFQKIGTILFDMIKRFDPVINAVFKRDDEAFLYYYIAMSAYNNESVEKTEYAIFLINYYDKLGKYKRTLLMERILFSTATTVEDIKLSSALMHCFLSNHNDDYLSNNKIIKIEAVELIKEVVRFIQEDFFPVADEFYNNTGKELQDFSKIIDLLEEDEKDFKKMSEFFKFYFWKIIVKDDRIIDLYDNPQKSDSFSLSHLKTMFANLLYGIGCVFDYLNEFNRNQKFSFYIFFGIYDKDDLEKIKVLFKDLKVKQDNVEVFLSNKLNPACVCEKTFKWSTARSKLENEYLLHVEKLVLKDIPKLLNRLNDELDEMKEQESGGIDSDRESYAIKKVEDCIAEILGLVDDILNGTNILNDIDYSEYEKDIRQRACPDAGERSLLDMKLDEHKVAAIKNEFATSAKMMQVLKMIEKSENYSESRYDYSVALLPLTKSLEVVLNVLFARIELDDLNNTCRIISKYITYNNQQCVKNNNIELGPAAYLFCSNYRDRNSREDTYQPINEWWNRSNRYVDLSVLENQLSGCSVVIDDAGNEEMFGPEKDNSNILFEAILHISNEYRNPLTHTKHLNANDYEECKKKLISTYKLLWIMLAIMKEPEPEPDSN